MNDRFAERFEQFKTNKSSLAFIVNPLNTNTNEINIEPFGIDAGSLQMQLLDLKTKVLWSVKFTKFKSVGRVVGIEMHAHPAAQLPKNEDEWLYIAQQYENQWNFSNSLGAIDGKPVVIQCPNNTSTEFFYYKGTFNVVLLALVDAFYCFMFVDIRWQGRISNGGVFINSGLLSKLKMRQLKLPHDRQLQPSGKNLPYVFLGNSRFASNRHMMKPYPGNLEKGSTQRIFNYRLSRARRVVENVFGIMASVRKLMTLQPDKVSNVTLTCVFLSNFMLIIIIIVFSTFDIEADREIIPDRGEMAKVE
ncbi:hypothetical protein HNY73_005023 [Argiope bruennichi]|uniref:DDE Tnp4 domain-containing protein n=1 Tax=Argiope bruennichi TaxID=94029 RepID=A0A8T0FF46_ARGBR|nr:hypothetical protein HNY73_005023 [Argiope bruennichi]